MASMSACPPKQRGMEDQVVMSYDMQDIQSSKDRNGEGDGLACARRTVAEKAWDGWWYTMIQPH